MVGLKEQVVLPQKYRFKILARPELKEFASGIEWVENEETALARASGVVIAVPPVYQPEIIARCLQLPRLNYLLVEKPLATSPSLADQTLDLLLKSKKTFRIAYSFLGTSWCNTLRLREHTRHDKHISIAWQFMAHHFRHGLHNWKRLHAQGGGVLRFFGIHLVALLSMSGYDEVVQSVLCGGSADEPESWTATLSGPGLLPCKIIIHSRSHEAAFTIDVDSSQGKSELLTLVEPFELESSGNATGLDSRMHVLVTLLKTLKKDDSYFYNLYKNMNHLWTKIEAASVFESSAVN